MEDKRLNFNRPLISVRRFSPTVSKSQKEARRKNEGLPKSLSYKSELHSGPLRNPGTVPFVWEQSPGRPKDETKTQNPLIVPNLPPGRITKPRKQDFDTITQSLYVEKCSKKETTHLRNDTSNDDDDDGNSKENEKPEVTYGPNFLLFNDNDNDQTDFDEHGNISFKFCGLLPQFCLKGSIGILNPSPGFSVRTKLPLYSATRSRVGSSSTISQRTSQMPEHANGILNTRNESEKEEINLQKKGLVSFKELLANEKENEDLTIEKTLYVDTLHKVNENDADVFGISHIPTESTGFDLFADTSKHDRDMITNTRLYNDRKVDQKVKVISQIGSDLPAPPPLPKSPSDSWLWRTTKHKPSYKGKNVQSQHP